MLAVRVQGGTGAGVRPPPADRKPDWTCPNGHANRGFVRRCLHVGCNLKRP